MKSWEVLREAIDPVGVKVVAAKLGLSTALVYKWCQEAAADDPEGSGARNPLDRLKIVYELTRDGRIVNWLCQAAGGFFVHNPRVDPREHEENLLSATQRFVQDFGALLSEISTSIENDGEILPGEADRIRQSWERLKSQAEAFVVGCEQGMYTRAGRARRP